MSAWRLHAAQKTATRSKWPLLANSLIGSGLQLMEGPSEADRKRMAGAIWPDKLGRGPDFLTLVIEGTDGVAAPMLLDALGDRTPRPSLRGVPRSSARMALEDAGIPTVWVEWAKDRHLHKPSDTWESIQWEQVAAAADAALWLARARSRLSTPAST